MGQLIHQYELGISLERSINIKFTKGHSFVSNLFHRKLLQAVQKCHRLGSGMGFYVSSNHIDATLLRLMSRLKHGIGLSDTCGITEKDFEFSAFLSGCIVTDCTKKLIRILSWQFHFNPPICHSSKSDSLFQYYNTQRQNLHLRLIHGKFVQASNEKIDDR